MIKKNNLLCLKVMPAAACICGLLLNGCSNIGLAQESSFESAYENVEEEEPVNIYTSNATVIVQEVDAQSQTVTVHMVEKNESRTFDYTGGTLVQDKYGSMLSMAQINPGDIADIQYNNDLEKIGSMMLSADAWSREDISKYDLDIGNDSATIGSESFNMAYNVQIFSEGRSIGTEQIIHQDVLSFQGMGSSILSITVDQGHGYLKLENDQAVVGGWIEIGQVLISQIMPDMLFTVPEGSYTVRFSGTGVEETREVVIERNKETVLDLSDIEIPQPEKGLVTIKVTPQSAKVFIDEKEVETTYPVRVPLGLHKITAKASGYDTVSEYFEVDGEDMTVSLELGQTKTVSGNGIFSEEETEAKITIQAPAGVEVYQDNLYMGIAPVTYKKTAGDHVITLRKQGYITRSHDITVPDDGRDALYSFPDLEPENANTVSGNNIGGNTASGNSVSGNALNDNKNNGTSGNGSSDNNSSGNGTTSGDKEQDTVSGNTVSGNSVDEEVEDVEKKGNLSQ